MQGDRLLDDPQGVPVATNVNRFRQIKAMLWKNLLYKRRMKAQIAGEIILPIVIVLYMRFVLRNPCAEKDSDCSPDEKRGRQIGSSIANPIVMALVVPSLFSFAQRFILQSIVEDKMNKMRETLQLMSLTRFGYAVSFFIFQGIFAIIGAVIFAIGMYNYAAVFPDDPSRDSLIFGLAVFLFAIAQIPYCMTLSTLFTDSKLASQIGGILLLIPELVFLWFAAQKDNSKYTLYAFFPLPVVPACSIFVKLSTNNDPQYADLKIIDANFLSWEACWAALIVDSIFWLFVYIYLDAVMPSNYGVQRHPCFCFIKQGPKKLRKISYADLEHNNNEKIYNKNDPILLDQLTKQWGNFKAVNKLTFSIKENEVFTFLGHNGAGKTTTINMLTGMINATDGDATVYGNSILTDINRIQLNMGLCQ